MKQSFVNYAHRGASSYAPENTMSAFLLGLEMGANGIETDVQRTKDGVLVLFHDDTIKRVTGQEGRIQDYTYEQLLQFDVCCHGRKDKIVTFRDFLETFSGMDLQFAIEFKQEFTEKETIDLLEQYGMREKTILTSFKLDCLMRAKLYRPDYVAGYLTRDVNPMTVKVLRTMGVEQACPRGDLVTPDFVDGLHSQGFSVRAWGIRDEELMKQVYDAGADGMTVNFPDKLTAYMAENPR